MARFRNVDPARVTLDRIRMGQPIGAEWLTGKRRGILLKLGARPEDLEPYDLGKSKIDAQIEVSKRRVDV